MRWCATVLVSILELGLCSCFTKQKQFVMPPPVPVAARPLPQPEVEPPPSIDAKIAPIEVPPLVLEAPTPPETPPAKPAQKKKPPTTLPGTPPTTTPPTTEAEPPPTTPPAPTAPQLSEILTDDRRKQYEADFAGSVSRAKGVLSLAAGRRLTPHQREAVQRINTFLQQAEESKGRDIATAVLLARRADLLGQDLQKSLR